MTIAADDPLVNTYVGNGVTDTFDFTFKITAEDELNVIVVGVAFLELGTDYTVTGVGVTGGGSITLTAGPLDDGAEIRIYDWVQPSQLVPFANQGAFRGYQHENAFDKVTRAVKRALGYATRSLTLAEDTPWYINRTLPDPIPGGYYRWDQDGLNMEISAITGYTDIGTTSGTVCAGDDSRLDNVAPGELGAADTTDGTEKWIASKDGEGIDLTAGQVLGDPVRAMRRHTLDHVQGYTDFHRVPTNFLAAAGVLFGITPYTGNGGICALEEFTAHFSGTGAGVLTGKFLGVTGFVLTTGSDTTGYVSIQHLQNPLKFNPNYAMETTFKGGINAVLPSVEDQTVQLGFTSVATALATAGMYFEATGASANWFAVVRANSGAQVTKKNTGVAYSTDATVRFKIVFDPNPDDIQTRFYINEVLVATIIPSETIVATLTPLFMSAQCRKVAGTTAGGLGFYDHSFKVQTDELVGF